MFDFQADIFFSGNGGDYPENFLDGGFINFFAIGFKRLYWTLVGIFYPMGGNRRGLVVGLEKHKLRV